MLELQRIEGANGKWRGVSVVKRLQQLDFWQGGKNTITTPVYVA